MNHKFICMLIVGLIGWNGHAMFKRFISIRAFSKSSQGISLLRHVPTLHEVTPAIIQKQPVVHSKLTYLQRANVMFDSAAGAVLGFASSYVGLACDPIYCALIAFVAGGIRAESRYAVEKCVNKERMQTSKASHENAQLKAQLEIEKKKNQKPMNCLDHFSFYKR